MSHPSLITLFCLLGFKHLLTLEKTLESKYETLREIKGVGPLATSLPEDHGHHSSRDAMDT